MSKPNPLSHDPFRATLVALAQAHATLAEHWDRRQAHWLLLLEHALYDFSDGADARICRLGRMEGLASAMGAYHAARAGWLCGSLPADTLFASGGGKGDVVRISEAYVRLRIEEKDQGREEELRGAKAVNPRARESLCIAGVEADDVG